MIIVQNNFGLYSFFCFCFSFISSYFPDLDSTAIPASSRISISFRTLPALFGITIHDLGDYSFQLFIRFSENPWIVPLHHDVETARETLFLNVTPVLEYIERLRPRNLDDLFEALENAEYDADWDKLEQNRR